MEFDLISYTMEREGLLNAPLVFRKSHHSTKTAESLTPRWGVPGIYPSINEMQARLERDLDV